MNKKIKILGIIFLFVWLLFLLAEKINLFTADLGRHLKNGELILNGNFRSIVDTNFYSYTHTDFPFINHHWLSGVVLFLWQKAFGFGGLSILYLFFFLLAFGLIFYLAQKEFGYRATFLSSVILIPLIADRKEVRPEMFTLFFSATFVLLFWSYLKERISKKIIVFFLILIQFFWVNLHIGFVFGWLIGGLFFLEDFIRNFYLLNSKKSGADNLFSLSWLAFKQSKFFFGLCLLIFFVSLANPHGIFGATYPFKIFDNFGYQLAENQSVWFLENYGLKEKNFYLIKLAVVVSLGAFFLILKHWFFFLKKEKGILTIIFLGIIFSWLGIFVRRNFSLAGLFFLPTFAFLLVFLFDWLQNRMKTRMTETTEFFRIGGGLILAVFVFIFSKQKLTGGEIGIGVDQTIFNAANFFKEHKIQGPIMNNYDVGGYLIYSIFPEQKLFVDNRPEAYPAEFFTDEYIPMQENEELWKEKLKQYDFNVIFFYLHDLTPWGQNFLINRSKDDDWSAVYVDKQAIIFLKKNQQNRSLIEQYEIPKERFGVSG